MKLIKGDQEILVSEIKEGKAYKGWHLHFTCEKCYKDIITKDWYNCKKKINKGEYLCRQCSRKKTNLEKYGVEHPLQNNKIKGKLKQTNLEKYGVENVSQNNKIKEKVKQTNLEKYGVENVSQNSKIKEKVKQTNLERYSVEYAFQNEKVKQKIKQTFLEKYGVENVAQNEKIKEKTKQTNLGRYGTEYVLQNNEIKEKVKQTFLERYGTEHPLQNNKIKEKVKQTNLERYGVENVSQNNKIKEKVKQTNLEKYGAEHALKNDEFKKKLKQTNLEKYGVEHPLQNKEIKEKVKQIFLEKYGVENPMQNKEIKQKYKEKLFLSLYDKFTDLTPLFSIDEYNGVDKKYKWRCECSHEFYDHLNNGRKPRCLKCYPRQKQTSQYEGQIAKFLGELNISNIKLNSKDVIAPYELDIYLSDYNLAIEFNGLWWHSNEYKDKFYHLDKTNECLKKGIDLIHIFEDEWIEKNDIVKSIIRSKINKSDKIYARKCIIKEVNSKDIYKFLELNHIQGSISSPINYGLYFNDKLVSLLCLGKSRFNKNYDYEIYRFCNKINVSVVGGFSKLLKHFQKGYKGSIITYADKRYFTGSVYRNNDFEELEPSKPNYFYIKGEKRYGRLNFQKHKLKDKLNEFYEELTEAENMMINGYKTIYDCGNHVFVKKDYNIMP